MKAQLICLNSRELFNNFNSDYGLNFHPAIPLKAVEVRDIPAHLWDTVKLSQIPHIYTKLNNDKSILLTGPEGLLSDSAGKLSGINMQLSAVVLNSFQKYSLYDQIVYKIGGVDFSFSKSYIMGILNITPDSFSDGGKYFNQELALEHAVEMIDQGADIIDIGGESTRPGSIPVSEEEEIRRVIPVIKGVKKLRERAVISIDTTKSLVAAEALKAGATIINDISGLEFDPKISEVAAAHNAALIVMHIKGTPNDMQKGPFYDNVVQEIYDHLWVQTEAARKAGVNNIIVDPGIGFGKRIDDNFELLKRLQDFKSLGYPILIGLSRKSFLGKYLNLPVEDRDTSSSIADAFALKNGARIIRTHNVKNGVMLRELFNKLT